MNSRELFPGHCVVPLLRTAAPDLFPTDKGFVRLKDLGTNSPPRSTHLLSTRRSAISINLYYGSSERPWWRWVPHCVRCPRTKETDPAPRVYSRYRQDRECWGKETSLFPFVKQRTAPEGEILAHWLWGHNYIHAAQQGGLSTFKSGHKHIWKTRPEQLHAGNVWQCGELKPSALSPV